MHSNTIVRWVPSGKTERWFPTTLDQLGKYEEFLEDALAASPELLLLESRRTGIRGPFKIFRQVSMQTPFGRGICPDLVLFAASGHVVVVEVKRSVNSELKDRAVIAQIIDYASSFAALTEKDCVSLFGVAETSTWTECMQRFFPDELNPDELGEVLLERMQRGELNLVIACDKVPVGLPDVVAGITSQSALGFELDLLEVVPYVREVSETAEILFVPSTRLSTEIVSRTAVTVTYREGDAKPSTTVETTSLDNIEANLKSAKRGTSADARSWTAEDVEEACLERNHPVVLKLLDFAKKHSSNGEFVAPGKKIFPSFGWFPEVMRDGAPMRRVILHCVVPWDGASLYLNHVEEMSSTAIVGTFRKKLSETFGNQLDVNKKGLSIPHELLEVHWKDFEDIMLWLKSKLELSSEEP